MARGKYKAKNTLVENRKDTSQPRPKTPPWLRRTVFGRHRAKFLIGGGIIVSIVMISIVTVGIIFFAGSTRKKESIGDGVTMKTELPKKIIVPSQGPPIECEDFHSLARALKGPEIILKNVFRERLKTMMETNRIVEEMKYLYEFCMDQESIETYGVESLKGVIRRMGGWPLMGLKTDNDTCHPQLFCLRSGGEKLHHHFISTWVVPCPSNRTYCLKLSPDFDMDSKDRCSRPYGKQMDSVCTNLKYVAIIFQADSLNLQRFFMSCYNLITSINDNCDRLSRPDLKYWQNASMTFDEYERENGYKRILIRNTIPENVTLTNRTLLYLKYPEMIRESLNHTLTVRQEGTMDIAMWEFVSSFKFYLPKYLRGNLSQPVLFGTLEHIGKKDRWEGCMDEVLSTYPSTSMEMYRTEYYDSETEENVKRIFEDVKTGFTRIFAKMNWMDNRTRDKLMSISLYEPKTVRDIFGNLIINKTNPIQTVLSLKYLKLIRNFSYLNEDFDLEDEEFAEIDKNDPSPHYMKALNQLYIPVETLHMYFEKGRPDYMNYVALGFMIAREIAYDFNHQGSGTITPEIEEVNCFVNQVWNYTTPQWRVQYNKRVGKEIVADYVGLRTAYAAYEISIERTNNSQPTDSTYNNQQLFWIAAGKLFSSHNTVESQLIPYLKEFNLAFGCRIDSDVYPKKACGLH